MMDRTEAARRLADVVNLADDVAIATGVASRTEQRIDLAHQVVVSAEANHEKAKDSLARAQARLEEAQARMAEVDPDLLDELAAELGPKRAARQRYLDALDAADPAADAEHIAEIAALAAEAGAVMAHAEPATAGAAGRED